MKNSKKDIHKEFLRRVHIKSRAGLSNTTQLCESYEHQLTFLESTNDRIEKIMTMIQNRKKQLHSVYVYVIYDISDSKIRGHVAKYLERNGLARVQFSVFFGDVKRDCYMKLRATLKEINEMYTNQDSIFIIPVGEDILNKTTVIGKNIDFEIMASHKSTFFI